EWSRVLELTDQQRDALIEIRRRLRSVNAPYVRQLDSLRVAAGVNMESRGRMDEHDAEALKRFQEWSVSVMESIRLNNEGARREIRALLAEVQLIRADSLNAGMRAQQRERRSSVRPGARPGAPPSDEPASGALPSDARRVLQRHTLLRRRG
ncbi:MAG: hypothetical protein IT360_20475, partial [Gemmatimonadaceae bacterium]|nr:hypothetical protein [Gemmatimonadaceae bacterium]